MDKQKASCVLEFILRQPIDDSLANAVFYALPIPSLDPHLQKTLLLRRIGSDLAERSISEWTLYSLELIEELDRTEGKAVPESMKAAYCAVAVECTSRPLRESHPSYPGNFFDAVNRIWNGRVADLERSEAAGLVSDRLRVLGNEMKEAVVNPIARARVLQRDAKREAMDTVREYLEETLKEMGPPFLERAAEAMSRKRKASGGGWRSSGVSGAAAAQHATDGASPVELGCPASDASDVNGERAVPMHGIEGGEKESSVSGVPEEQHALDGAIAARLDPLSIETIRERTAQVQGIGGEKESIVAGVPEEQHALDGVSAAQLDPVSIETNRERTAQVQGIEGGEKESSVSGVPEEQHALDGDSAAQLDPLSIETNRERIAQVQGIDTCEGSTTAREMDASKHGSGCPNKYDILPTPEVWKMKEALNSSYVRLQKVVEDLLPDAVAMSAGVLSRMGEKPMNQNQVDANVSRPFVDKRAKVTACTYKWDDDSMEYPYERSPNSSKKVCLYNPRKRAISPLKLQEITKIVRKRKFKRWSTLEEGTLREAVKRHGKGNWKFILSCYPGIFDERTEVDLKDKWRNMTRQREIPMQGIGGEKQSGVSGVPEERHALDGASAMELVPLSIETNIERTTQVQGIGIAKYDILPAPKVRKLKAIKSRCVGLQKVVEDPHPDAIAMVVGVLNSMEEKTRNPGPSLMDRNPTGNPTARNYEWDYDSIESPPERSPSSSEKVCLPSPRKRAGSPLKVQEITKGVKRRKFKRWSTLEEDTLREGVKRHGKGNWKFILSCYSGIFEERSEVDLKDKWRNMTKQ